MEAEPVPIYGAPATPDDYSLPVKIREWNREYGNHSYRDILLIQRLSRFLNQDDVCEVLSVLEKTCPRCWDHNRPCHCKRSAL